MLLLSNFIMQDKGVTAIEYGLIAAIIALSVVAGATIIGDSLSQTFAQVAASLL